jgi:hypothetical protein
MQWSRRSRVVDECGVRGAAVDRERPHVGAVEAARETAALELRDGRAAGVVMTSSARLYCESRSSMGGQGTQA